MSSKHSLAGLLPAPAASPVTRRPYRAGCWEGRELGLPGSRRAGLQTTLQCSEESGRNRNQPPPLETSDSQRLVQPGVKIALQAFAGPTPLDRTSFRPSSPNLSLHMQVLVFLPDPLRPKNRPGADPHPVSVKLCSPSYLTIETSRAGAFGQMTSENIYRFGFSRKQPNINSWQKQVWNKKLTVRT